MIRSGSEWRRAWSSCSPTWANGAVISIPRVTPTSGPGTTSRTVSRKAASVEIRAARIVVSGIGTCAMGDGYSTSRTCLTSEPPSSSSSPLPVPVT